MALQRRETDLDQVNRQIALPADLRISMEFAAAEWNVLLQALYKVAAPYEVTRPIIDQLIYRLGEASNARGSALEDTWTAEKIGE